MQDARSIRRLSTLAVAIVSAAICGCHPSATQVAGPVQHAPVASGGAQSKPIAQAKWVIQSDDWYCLTLAGTPAGWIRMIREDDGSRYRTVNEMTLGFHRAGMDLDADNYVEWTESHDGQPLRVLMARKDRTNPANSEIGKSSVWEKTRDGDPHGLLTARHEWEFKGPRATKVIDRDGKIERMPEFIPKGDWLTPAAAERFIHRQIAENASAMEYGTLEASDTLRVVTIHSALIGPSDFAFDGKLIPVTVWQTGTSSSAAQATSHYSQDGKLMYSSNDLGMGVLETRRCKKEEAIPTAAAPASAPQVDYPGVKPDRALTAKSRAIFEIRLTQGKLPRLPSAGAQIAEMSDDGNSARVTIDSAKTSAATGPELADAQLRERSPIMGSDDSTALDLAAQSMRETEGLGVLELAKSSRAVVHRFAGKEPAASAPQLGGTAGQVRDTGAEAARMLSAVLRVHRIASRLATGLAYSTPPHGASAFEWRVWTQALIDERWVDLDPSGTEPFDAGHILTGFAGMGTANADPDPAGFAKLLSNLQIKVISQE